MVADWVHRVASLPLLQAVPHLVRVSNMLELFGGCCGGLLVLLLVGVVPDGEQMP